MTFSHVGHLAAPSHVRLELVCGTHCNEISVRILEWRVRHNARILILPQQRQVTPDIIGELCVCHVRVVPRRAADKFDVGKTKESGYTPLWIYRVTRSQRSRGGLRGV